MRKILLPLFLVMGAMCSIGANAQTVQIYKAGSVVGTYADADSIVFSQATTAVGEPIGKFYVSDDKQVAFAPGNLQYHTGANIWRFAEHQYDTIGYANSHISASYDGWIDLFGWSVTNAAAPFGISASENDDDYVGDFVDWGANRIGTYAPNTWRTLTYDEWMYMFKHTPWTMARVDGILGFMLLPKSMEGVTLLGSGNESKVIFSFYPSKFSSNRYTAAEFALLEAMGCVFLPCAGERKGTIVNYTNSCGYYWSSTLITLVFHISFSAYNAGYGQTNSYYGRSVRLVKDL